MSQAIGNAWELIGNGEAYIEKTPQGLSAGKGTDAGPAKLISS